MSSGKLIGKVSIITGSTTGIGFSIAKRFFKEGSKVVISSRKQQNVDNAIDKLVSVAKEFQLSESNLMGMVCHVGKQEDRQKLVDQTVKKFGGVNILVNNAVVSPVFGPICDIKDEAFRKIMDTNVQACFSLCKETLPYLKNNDESPSTILFISSIGGYNPLPMIGAYSVSKTALLGLTKVLATELAHFNIRVNCLAPGVVKTKLSEGITNSSDISEQILNTIPMRRFAEPDEISGPALFLCSDDSSYITGETICVSGGFHSKL